MKKQILLEASESIAHIVNNIDVDVVCAFPITPQTHIVENLAKLKNDGKADYEYVYAESEFGAGSIILGSTAVNSRSYTATSSQGLLLMTEVLFAIGGMKLPCVIGVANRSISAPLSIWNDQQDALTMRDAGWIMLYAETVQEILDMHILAYKIAEKLEIPVMVNFDGFILSHVMEPIILPSKSDIKKFLPKYDYRYKLDPKKPLTLGGYAGPESWMEIRKDINDDVYKSLSTIQKEYTNFEKVFGRKIQLVETYQKSDTDTAILSLGSISGTIKQAIDEGLKVKNIKLTSLRPFPQDILKKELKGIKKLIIFDKSISLGVEGVLGIEVKSQLYGKNIDIKNVIISLAGRDVSVDKIKEVVKNYNKYSYNKANFIL